MTFSLSGLIWFLIACMCIGIALLISLMRFRKSSYKGMFILDTDTSQKKKTLIAYLIIHITTFLIYTALLIRLGHDFLSIFSILLTFFYFIYLMMIKLKQYEIYIEFFRNLRQKHQDDQKP